MATNLSSMSSTKCAALRGRAGSPLPAERSMWFFAAFNGVETPFSSICCNHASSNPERIESFSPGLARFREGLPWVMALMRYNPVRVEPQSFNPERIDSFSPGLARFREGLPWVVAFKRNNPVRVESQFRERQIQPLQGCAFFVFSPRVARSAQPWAESFNRVAIGNTNRNFFHA